MHIVRFRFGDGETEDGEPRPAPVAPPPSKGKGNVLDGLKGEDGNINIGNVSTAVVGKVGNLFGKGVGTLGAKLGGGSWF